MAARAIYGESRGRIRRVQTIHKSGPVISNEYMWSAVVIDERLFCSGVLMCCFWWCKHKQIIVFVSKQANTELLRD